MTRPLIVLLAALAAWPALGAKVRPEDRLGDLSGQVDSVTAAVESLERQVAPGRGFITEQDAVRRYEDCVYLFLVGDYAMAAEGFFSLVTLAALTDAGLHRDAEWYLAESLFQMGNTSTAEARYLVIAQDDTHPFRDDAVRRLLELYALTGQTEQFAALYKREIVGGKVRPSDLITYSLAKSFYFQGDIDEAARHFVKLGPDSEFWAKARYFLGSIAVQRSDWEGAFGCFREAADVAVTTPDQRKIQDLSLLALARVRYEQGRLAEAAEFYQQVGGDSPYLADKLYEVVWTFIKQEQYTAALDGVEIFLLQFPEHEYTAQMRLLEAHLRLEQKDWDEALGAYEKVVTDYTPVREQFGELARSDDEQDWFRQILAAADGQASDAGGLPGYAVAMMVGDPGMSRALDVFREIDRQEEQIAASEALIVELREVMGTASGIGGHDRLRYEVGVERGRALDAQVGLLAFEEAWLEEQLFDEREDDLEDARRMRQEVVSMIERMPDDIGSEESIAARREHLEALEALQHRVDELAAKVEQKETALASAGTLTREEAAAKIELETAQKEHDAAVAELEAQRAAGPSTAWSERLSEQEKVVAVSIDEARRAYQPLRVGMSDPQGTLARIDRLQTTLAADQERLSSLRLKLVAAESDELARIRVRFDHEVREVESQRADLGDTMGEAEEVSTALTRAGFGRLEDRFERIREKLQPVEEP